MKKSFCFMKIVSALFALALFASCDTGGGGGGGGGGNSAQTSKTNITITIPSATSSSSDINLLGDFSPEYARDNFCYVIYYKKNSTTSEKISAKAGDKVTFNDVKYDTYDFVLEIYVDENKNENTLLNKITKTVTVSASNNTVTFPDMSTSSFSEWFFVSTTDQLTDALNKILPETSSFSASKKAKICLKASIEYNNAESIKNNDKIKIIDNGFSFAACLYTVTLPSDLPAGCSVATNSADNKFAENVTVTLTVTAGTGYKFKSISYGAAGSTAQDEPTEVEAGVTYIFQMPANDVSVSAMFIPVYTITYNLNGGSAVADSGFESTARYTEDNFVNGVYTLPGKDKVSKPGYLFYGWYTDLEFLGSKVTQIASTDVLENKTFYARWIDSIYVKSDGVNTNDGLTADTPVNAIQTAVSKIAGIYAQLGNQTIDWKIVVVGTLTGTQIIDAFSSADSLEITGGESGGTINGNGSTENSVLSINCGVPVTIKNLTITGGGKSRGAGIYIDAGANVTLGAGTKVTGNNGSGSAPTGGGVYVYGTLTVTDDAEISGNTAANSDNTSGFGGGICFSSNATVTISGNAKIINNSAYMGDGICAHNDNPGTLTLEGSPTIQDICLAENLTENKTTITVNDASLSGSFNVTLKPNSDFNYLGRDILTGTAVGSVYSKFTLTNAGPYKIGNIGMLVAKDVGDFTLADFAKFETDNKFQSSEFPTSLLTLLNKVILYKKTGTTTYFVMKITELDSGVLGYSGKVTAEADLYAANGSKTSFSFDCIGQVNIVTGDSDEFGVGLDNHVSFGLTNCEIYGSSVKYYIIPED